MGLVMKANQVHCPMDYTRIGPWVMLPLLQVLGSRVMSAFEAVTLQQYNRHHQHAS